MWDFGITSDSAVVFLDVREHWHFIFHILLYIYIYILSVGYSLFYLKYDQFTDCCICGNEGIQCIRPSVCSFLLLSLSPLCPRLSDKVADCVARHVAVLSGRRGSRPAAPVLWYFNLGYL